MKQRKGRMLRENCLESKKLAKATHAANNLWFRLLVKVDDYGNFLDDAAVIKTGCFLWRPGLKNSHVKRLVDELQRTGLLSRYEVNGERFIHLERFEDFQELRYERAARFPRLIAPSGQPESTPEADGDRPTAAPPRASTPPCLPSQDSPRAGTPPCPRANPNADNESEREVKKKRSEAEAAAARKNLWLELGVDARRLPPAFRELCEGLYACKGGQSTAELVGVCMDVWTSGGNKIPPQFARCAAEIREAAKQKKAGPELPELEELAWRKR